jgi:hypothetical protein
MEGKILKDPLTLALYRGVERGERAKFFEDTPHFCSLPQGERRIKRMPLTLALSRKVERGEGR